MKAVVAQGGRAVLVKDRALPTLRDDCVLVKVAAVALNPTDWKHLYRGLVPDGCLLGCDFSGTVEQIGKGVTKKWCKGDRIAGVVHGGNSLQPEDGAFAEFVVAKGDICIRLPAELSFEKGATLPLGIGTVMQGLYQKGLKMHLPDDPVQEQAYVLIYGGSTAAGALGIQFAKRSGYTILTTCSSKSFDYVKNLGADHVSDYNQPNLGTEIRCFTENTLKLAWDTISNADSAQICSDSLSSNAVGVRYASFLSNKSPRSEIVSVGTHLYTIWGEEFKTGQVDHPAIPEDLEWAKSFMPLAEDLIFRDQLKPHREFLKGDGLKGVVSGLEELKNGLTSSGKLVYKIVDTP